MPQDWKWIVGTCALLMAGALTAYSTAFVVVKATFNFRLWIVYSGLLLVAFGAVNVVTRLSERIWTWMLFGSKA